MRSPVHSLSFVQEKEVDTKTIVLHQPLTSKLETENNKILLFFSLRFSLKINSLLC
jgi:hypothetical protein